MARTASVNKWDAELAALAAQSAATEDSAIQGGNFLSTRNNKLSYQGAEVPGNKLNIIVLDAIMENVYYKGNYDPASPCPPNCFAFARSAGELAPHESVQHPEHESCAGCPQVQWGTARIGKGKACKEIRRVAMLTEGDLEDIETAEVAFLKLNIGSVKGFAGYVKNLADVLHKPPLAFITELKLIDDDKFKFQLVFTKVSPITDGKVLSQLMAKREAIQGQLFNPYPQPEEEEAPPPKAQPRKSAPSSKPSAAPAAAPARKSRF